MKRITRPLLLLTIITASGCGVLLPSSDTFLMVGNEEAIRAYHDSINGLVTNSKTTDPAGNSAYWDSRYAQEKQRTQRSGFWQKLIGGAS